MCEQENNSPRMNKQTKTNERKIRLLSSDPTISYQSSSNLSHTSSVIKIVTILIMFIWISLPLVTTEVTDSYQSLLINQLLSSFKRFDEVGGNSQDVHRTFSLALSRHGTAWWPLAVRLPSQNGTVGSARLLFGVGNNLLFKQVHRFYLIYE